MHLKRHQAQLHLVIGVVVNELMWLPPSQPRFLYGSSNLVYEACTIDATPPRWITVNTSQTPDTWLPPSQGCLIEAPYEDEIAATPPKCTWIDTKRNHYTPAILPWHNQSLVATNHQVQKLELLSNNPTSYTTSTHFLVCSSPYSWTDIEKHIIHHIHHTPWGLETSTWNCLQTFLQCHIQQPLYSKNFELTRMFIMPTISPWWTSKAIMRLGHKIMNKNYFLLNNGCGWTRNAATKTWLVLE